MDRQWLKLSISFDSITAKARESNRIFMVQQAGSHKYGLWPEYLHQVVAIVLSLIGVKDQLSHVKYGRA